MNGERPLSSAQIASDLLADHADVGEDVAEEAGARKLRKAAATWAAELLRRRVPDIADAARQWAALSEEAVDGLRFGADKRFEVAFSETGTRACFGMRDMERGDSREANLAIAVDGARDLRDGDFAPGDLIAATALRIGPESSASAQVLADDPEAARGRDIDVVAFVQLAAWERETEAMPGPPPGGEDDPEIARAFRERDRMQCAEAFAVFEGTVGQMEAVAEFPKRLRAALDARNGALPSEPRP